MKLPRYIVSSRHSKVKTDPRVKAMRSAVSGLVPSVLDNQEDEVDDYESLVLAYLLSTETEMDVNDFYSEMLEKCIDYVYVIADAEEVSESKKRSPHMKRFRKLKCVFLEEAFSSASSAGEVRTFFENVLRRDRLPSEPDVYRLVALLTGKNIYIWDKEEIGNKDKKKTRYEIHEQKDPSFSGIIECDESVTDPFDGINVLHCPLDKRLYVAFEWKPVVTEP